MSVTSWSPADNWRGCLTSSTRGYAFQFSTTTGTVPLAVLIDKPEAIASRINSRDKTGHDAERLAAMQEQEVEHARAVGQALKIGVSLITSGDESAFREWITSSKI